MRRTILRGIDRSQILGAGVGCLLGFSVLLGGLQLYFDLKPLVEEESGVWDPGYFILNKKVSILDGLKEGGATFDSTEVAVLKEKEFVDDIAAFKSSDFKVSASTRDRGSIPGFRTQLFFEAVPDRFLDVDEAEWKWNPDDEFIPIVVPSHYIALYNFGFAQSQGLPQISKNLIERVGFQIELRGNGRMEEYQSRIVGFSDRINSILVPLDLLEWANGRFGRGSSSDPSRLILATDDPSGGGIFAFADEKGYEVQGGDRDTGRLSSLLRAGIWIVGGTAGIIILLASGLLIVSFRLLIVKNRLTIEKLHLLGYPLSRIRRVYSSIVGILNIFVLIGASVVAYLLKAFYGEALESAGFEIEGGLSFLTVLLGLLVLLLINGANELILTRQLKKAVE